MRDNGAISDKGKEQAAFSGKPRDFVRAQAQARQEQSTIPEKEQGKVPHSRRQRDFRRSLLERQARGTREAFVGRNTSRSSRFAPRSTWSDGASGLVVGSRPQENLPWSSKYSLVRKGMDGNGESSTQQQTNYLSSDAIGDTIRSMNKDKENKGPEHSTVIEDLKKIQQQNKREEEYESYTKKYGGTTHYR